MRALALALMLSACGPKTALRVRSPDKLHVAEVIESEDGRRQHVVIDGRPRAPWDGVAAVEWSPSSDRVAYVASAKGKRWIVVGDRAFGPWAGVGEIVWAADGREVAAAIDTESGGAEKRWTVARIGDDVELGPLVAGIAKETLRFGRAPFGGRGRLTWVAIESGAQRLVDRTMGPAFASVLPAEVDATGEHLLVRARHGKLWHVLVDGADLATSEEVPQLAAGDGTFAYTIGTRGKTSAHWRRLGDPRKSLADLEGFEKVGTLRMPSFSFPARRAGKDVVVTRGKEHGPYDGVLPLSLVQAPGGARVVFAATAAKGIGFYDEGKLLQDGFDEVSPPEFSTDGRHLGFFALTGGVVKLHVRGEQHLAAPDPTGLVLTSKRFAYTARRGSRMVVVHDRGEQAHDVVMEGSITFAGEDGPWGCVAANAGERSIYVAFEDGTRLGLDKIDFLRDLAIDPLDVDGPEKQKAAQRAWVRAAWKRASPPGPGDPFKPLSPRAGR